MEDIPTPERIRDNWEHINNLKGAKAFGDSTSAIFSMASPPPKKESAK
jgi:hypothetical protein